MLLAMLRAADTDGTDVNVCIDIDVQAHPGAEDRNENASVDDTGVSQMQVKCL